MPQSFGTNFTLERATGVPLFRQVASSVVECVGRGLLAPGTALPGTRTLAKSLGVHRNTVKAAYDELLADGWVNATPSRGTFIAAGAARQRSGRASEIACEVRPTVQLAYRRTLVCNEGLCDPKLAPAAELGRALRRALLSSRTWTEADLRGHPGLRASIAEILRSTRAIAATPEEILITGGRRMALDLIARVLIPEGATVAVEQPGNKAAWEIFAQCGLRVVGVPVDGEGIRTDCLENCAGVNAVYVTPARQYPTAVAMSAERRKRLLAWCRKTEVVIIEDDCDSELEFDETPMIPLAGMDTHISIVHIGTISSMFAPAAESGYVRATRPAVARLARLRHLIGQDNDRSLEAALFELATDGVLRRHLRRARSAYCERRDHFALALRQEFAHRLKLALPGGGLALWIEPGKQVDTRQWAESARRLGVRFAPASEYTIERSSYGGVRIGFGTFSKEELETVAATLRRSLPDGNTRIYAELEQDSSQLRRCIA